MGRLDISFLDTYVVVDAMAMADGGGTLFGHWNKTCFDIPGEGPSLKTSEVEDAILRLVVL